MIKALFFDFDGTLVDTHEANHLAYKQAIEDVTGIELVSTELNSLIRQGMSSRDFLPKVLPNATSEIIDAINTRKKDTYKAFISLVVPNTYLIEFARKMAKTCTIALVTTAKKANAETVLSEYKLRDIFDFCIFGDEVTMMKPDPEAYLIALERSGVEASEALVFEDSDKGAKAAEAAGISVIRVGDFL